VKEFNSGITQRGALYGIAAGPDGNLWFTGSDTRLGRITPAGVVTEFYVGIAAGGQTNAIVAGPDGNVWFTANGGLFGSITPNGAVSLYRSGVTARPDGVSRGLNGITVGPDGNLWFTETHGDRVGRTTAAPANPTAPARPTGLRANTTTTSSVQVLWDASAGATKYHVTWRKSSETTYTTVDAGNVTGYTITGLPSQTVIYVYVNICNDSGCSDWAGYLTLQTF
jgi:streptogramin lyase